MASLKERLGRDLSDYGKPVIVWHIGDHDPSGQHLFQSLADDILAFAGDLDRPVDARGPAYISFQRLAVTEAQIAEFGLPEAPAKTTDNRSFNGTGTVQAEALPPDVLARILRDALSQWFDVDAAQEAAEASAAARLEALETLKGRFS